MNRRIKAGARLAVATTALLAVAACGDNRASTAGPAVPEPQQQAPIASTAADWRPVADTLGRTGTLGDHDTVYRVPLPRKDLQVTSGGVAIKPGLSLGGYAAFARYSDGAIMMGDLVVTEAELPRVTEALQAHGITQTAVHKHLLEQSPPVWWTHIHAMGDPGQLAQGLRAALDATAIGPASATPTQPAQQPAVELDTAAIDQALGRKGTTDGGVYKFTIARREAITEEGHLLPPTFGLTTGINFQPVGGGKAAINGDLVMTATEVPAVVRALSQGKIDLVELHNHSLTEQPRLFYAHFWAVDDAVRLARALRAALDATNLQPAA